MMAVNSPKITFGMIVLNGEPFIRYNLRALYPFAHQIIVVEGAAPAAASIATPDGHSVDGTMQTLLDFKAHEDPENKLIVVTAEDEGHPNGFWPGEKHEQSQAYAKRATGNWLWQVDVDEFYQPLDMTWIIGELSGNPSIYAVSFKQIQFWGGLDYYADGWYLRHYGGEVFHRLFRWDPGYVYATHRPPTVVNEDGVDLRELGHLRARDLARRKIFLYHYSLVFPHQVSGKSAYYSQVSWGPFDRMNDWATENYTQLKHPYRVHNVYRYPSWLERYAGPHPPQVIAMWQDTRSSQEHSNLAIRQNDDIERLLNSVGYRVGRQCVKWAGFVICNVEAAARAVFRLLPTSVQAALKPIILRQRARV
ncbi:glycosyltransferase family 2 protein [Candidatus Chloroploca sp. M-50]|uniref:Glycosyltransferase family 2 protein n=1 Tax=Candidatus Chloroploca mongolica TaxID=2528176 RepID=A0ABS4D8G2_9CHLR|nr:glycosyltransferase family A protein [Candidatus Chloroploca mongolica]MBP1465734.1 glycosyltransferase family 2 protein [Candidatus Chloroploca mongolica]